MKLEGIDLLGSERANRRELLKVAGALAKVVCVGLLAGCGRGTFGQQGNEQTQGGQEVGTAASEGRLLARPGQPRPADATAKTGLRPLGLGSERDGLVYVPAGYEAQEPRPLALTLHGAGGDAESGLSHLLGLADEAGVVLLAPESRGDTWDVLTGGYGPDVRFIDRALEQTFGSLAVDARRLAVTGFSDGASYALSLGLTNGDLFTRVVGFSPGFMAPATLRGEPPVFVSHGTRDEVLPIDRCSRRIVPQLERQGYDVRYQEFDGPHTVPEPVARDALQWFASGRT